MADSNINKPVDSEKSESSAAQVATILEPADLINASGHIQELDRNFGLITAACLAITVGNAWPAVGGSILVAIFNGGPPGVIYEFIVVALFYFTIAASLAELASAIPSSGGVYHWASVTPGKKWGRMVGFFAGWWNFWAYAFGTGSMCLIGSNIVVQMYRITHPDFTPRSWHIFVAYVTIAWLMCGCVCLFNSKMPYVNLMAATVILLGFFVTVIVCTAMPGRGGRPPHATSSFVWTEWKADLGYPDGFVFVAGMLNGAYAVGIPDCVTHLSEEVPYPHKNIPKAMGLQAIIGFVTALVFLISLMYAINDYDALFDSPFPLAEIYLQATGSPAGAIGLLFIVLSCAVITLPGGYLTSGRALWTLARDKATPFPNFLSQVHPKRGMPEHATIACAVLTTLMGCLYWVSSTAFNALVGSFVLLSSTSYCTAILPHLLTGRKNIIYGPFRLRGWLGPICNTIACGYIIIWGVIYSFPFYLPTDAKSMNYASIIWAGLTIFTAAWWFYEARHGYVGPKTVGGINSEAERVRKLSTEDVERIRKLSKEGVVHMKTITEEGVIASPSLEDQK